MVNSIFEDNNPIGENSNIFSTSDDRNDVGQNDTIEESNDNNVDNQRNDIEEELHDVNAINVNIADKTAPLVVLFGPPACGKTMTLIRLTRFLSRQGFMVSPIRNFRPSYDTNYKALCDNFDELISSDDAASSTSKISFMLIEVMKSGRRLCQILEAPGELYFDRKKPSAQFPNFLNEILNRDNRKIWTIMVEPDWMEPSDRINYVNKIRKLQQRLRPRDKSIIVFNKIDQTSYVVGPGRIRISGAKREVANLYPGLFDLYRNYNPLTSWLFPTSVDFVPFQTGDYSSTSSGRQSFQEGPDEYPRMLWNVIMKRLAGK